MSIDKTIEERAADFYACSNANDRVLPSVPMLMAAFAEIENATLVAHVERLETVLQRANIELLSDGSHQFKPKAIRHYCGELTQNRIERLETALRNVRVCAENTCAKCCDKIDEALDS